MYLTKIFHYKKNAITKLFVFCLSIIILVFCSHPKVNKKKEVVLASVGNEKITVSDFRRNYEFGLPNLKVEPNRKLSYLQYMIYEKVLSLEGYKLGLNNSPRVKDLENDLLNELLIEELFIKNVNSKIVVKPEEVKQAILKSQVSWKMNYWFESNIEQAKFIRSEIIKNGFEKTIGKILKSNPELKFKLNDFETNYVTWLEIAPDVLDKIKNLSINQISEPIKLGKGYFLFQIKDIRRSGTTDFDLKNKYETFRQILYYRKLKKEAGKYVSSIMQPKNVITKGKALHELTTEFIAWKQDTLKQTFKDFVEKNNIELLNKPLVKFEKHIWRVSDFIKKFNTKRIKTTSLSKTKIAGEISKQIALEVRNNELVKLALKNNLDKNEHLKKQLKEWRDKWVYEEARKYFLKKTKITDKEAKDFFQNNITSFQVNAKEIPKYKEYKNTAKKFAYIKKAEKILLTRIDSLKKIYPIHINKEILDTIQTIDFQKSRWQSLQVFKRSSNRLAVPIVDPAWKIK